MKKRQKLDKKSILVILLLLLIGIIVTYIAVTYSRYTATVSRTGGIAIAEWNFKEDNKSDTFTIDLQKTYDASTLVANKIAPGTQGSFTISLSNANSDTGVNYEISIGNIENLPANMKLYSSASMSTTNQITQTANKLTGNLQPKTGTKNVTVYWKWDYEGGSGDESDNKSAGKSITVPVTITGVQVRPQ